MVLNTIKEANYYQCTKQGGKGAKLLFRGDRTDSKGYTKKVYRSSETDCKDCPLRAACCGRVSKFKKLDDSIDKPYYDRMHQKLTAKPVYAKKLSWIRSRTVEPVLGTLINFMNMKRLNSRGMASADKHVLLSALSYNLKKLMRFSRPKAKIVSVALKKVNLKGNEVLVFLSDVIKGYTLRFKPFKTSFTKTALLN